MNPASQPISSLLPKATRFLFFTGKGGVGKTSLACAVSLALAEAGKRVLLISTDPASNLDEVLGQELSSEPCSIRGASNLFALNLDPERAAAEYREKMVSPYRGKLPDAVIRTMEEQLSGACTVEIAAFNEFSRFLGRPEITEAYDHVIFDTAPTGHTLRLLSLPRAWSGYFSESVGGASCLGPLSGLDEQKELYGKAVSHLADGAETTLVLVSRAQNAALAEAARTSEELKGLGLANQCLVLNGVFEVSAPGDQAAESLERRSKAAMQRWSSFLSGMPVFAVPLQAHNLLGLDTLRALLQKRDRGPLTPQAGAAFDIPKPIRPFMEKLAEAGHGVIMTMGKGGVGKTTLAAAIATALSDKGYTVHLTTTDPAAHVQYAAGENSRLSISRIDPQKETANYVAETLASAGRNLDEDGRKLLEEDLRSPCTEEIAVFRAFARMVARGEKGFVVLDTAPTGHTLLLLDATESYHREVARTNSSVPQEVRDLLPRLRDPNYTRIFIVTLPEATPVHEASRLQSDLFRAGIRPYAWIINQSFVNTPSRDPLLQVRGRNEVPYINEVFDLSPNVAIVPWSLEEPVGPDKLRELFAG